MKGLILCIDGDKVNAIHEATDWSNAIQAALDNGPAFELALVIDLDGSCPPTIKEQGHAHMLYPDGTTDPYEVNVTVAHALEAGDAELLARHITPLQSPA